MPDNQKFPERLHIPIDALAQWHEKSPCLPAFDPVSVGDPHKSYVLEDVSALYVPGVWRCVRCSFELMQSNLNANDGTVTARDTPGDKCPNCDTGLWRVSWKDWATETAKRLDETWDELHALKATLADKSK